MNVAIADLYAACQSFAGGSTVEHLETLRDLASKSDVVVEFGVDRCATSVALLHGCKGEVYSYDIRKLPEVDALLRVAAGKWIFRQADSITADVPECDLLFIDSWHTGEQLTAELEAHCKSVRRWIAMHDTETCGIRGEDGEPGLWVALMAFLDRHPEWRLSRHYINNNGLSVLERT